MATHPSADEIVRPVQVNGAGPPVIATVASVGRLRRRYCCSGDSDPLTLNVGGATWPITSPTATTCPTITGNEERIPTAPAVTVTVLMTAVPSAAGTSDRIVSIGVAATTACPDVTRTFLTSPASVAFTGAAASADTVAGRVTSLVIVPVSTVASGSSICAVGTVGSVAVIAPEKNAILTRAVAIARKMMIRKIGKIHLRAIPTATPVFDRPFHPHPSGAGVSKDQS
jgi:hypothetical protein